MIAPRLMETLLGSAFHLLEKGAGKTAELADPETLDANSKRGEKNSRLVCARCSYPITSRDQRIEMSGAHEHTFANPHGHVFHIGCFRNAGGAVTLPAMTSEFTWFPGFAWSLSGCSLCGEHLGWRFYSGEEAFFGLILDRLIEKEEERG